MFLVQIRNTIIRKPKLLQRPKIFESWSRDVDTMASTWRNLTFTVTVSKYFFQMGNYWLTQSFYRLIFERYDSVENEGISKLRRKKAACKLLILAPIGNWTRQWLIHVAPKAALDRFLIFQIVEFDCSGLVVYLFIKNSN